LVSRGTGRVFPHGGARKKKWRGRKLVYHGNSIGADVGGVVSTDKPKSGFVKLALIVSAFQCHPVRFGVWRFLRTQPRNTHSSNRGVYRGRGRGPWLAFRTRVCGGDYTGVMGGNAGPPRGRGLDAVLFWTHGRPSREGGGGGGARTLGGNWAYFDSVPNRFIEKGAPMGGGGAVGADSPGRRRGGPPGGCLSFQVTDPRLD